MSVQYQHCHLILPHQIRIHFADSNFKITLRFVGILEQGAEESGIS